MRHFLYFLLLLRCCASLNAQYYNQQEDFLKANNVWCWGSNARLDFNNSNYPVDSISSANGHLSGASVSDPVTGNLLFYTNGTEVWNANGQYMPNGLGLMNIYQPFPPTQYLVVRQGVCVVPVLGSPGKYYIFSLHREQSFNPGAANYSSAGSLGYSIVDMSLDNGQGDIVPWQKNIPLSFDTLSMGGMIAIPGNNCDIWLLVHKYRHPEILAFHITANGINPTPVVSVAGTQIQGGYMNNSGTDRSSTAYRSTALVVSPNREYIAIVSSSNGSVNIRDTIINGCIISKFNPDNGTVSDGILISENLPNASTIPAFSPDNSKFYWPHQFMDTQNVYSSELIQYDISNYDSLSIANSAYIISDTIVPFSYNYRGANYSVLYTYKTHLEYNIQMRLFRDTIYLTGSGRSMGIPSRFFPVIHIIAQPNQAGHACGLQPTDLLFNVPAHSYGSLPTEVVYPLTPDTLFRTVIDTIICTKQSIDFRSVRLSAEEGYSAYEWDNGSTNRQRVINSPGTYWVLSKDDCHSRVDTFRFRYVDLPFSLGNDTVICNGMPLELVLTGLPSGTSFNWQDNSSGNTYTVTQSGKYWIEVAYEGCTLADTINVVLTDVQQYLGEDTVICNEPIQLTLQANVPQRATALWNTGATSASIPISDAGIYWVQVSEPPCIGSDTISLYYELCNCFVQMPNAFSPNGDGINDIFLPYIEPDCLVEQFNLNIYNRYGQRVYSGYSSSNGWDGRHNGVLADAGTYFFEVAFIAGTKGEKFYKKGDLILIR